jgi:hypothetical protein
MNTILNYSEGCLLELGFICWFGARSTTLFSSLPASQECTVKDYKLVLVAEDSSQAPQLSSGTATQIIARSNTTKAKVGSNHTSIIMDVQARS